MLEGRGEARIRDGLGRYGVSTADRVIGVPMGGIQLVGAQCGLTTDCRGAVANRRLRSAHVDRPCRRSCLADDRGYEPLTRDLDNCQVCDTLCFKLFDRSPHARYGRPLGGRSCRIRQAHCLRFARQPRLARQEKRRRTLPDAPCADRSRGDGRPHPVKKGVSWALRAIGGR